MKIFRTALFRSTCERLFLESWTSIMETSLLSNLISTLTLSWRRPLSYRNQSIDLRSNMVSIWYGFYMIMASVMKELKSVFFKLSFFVRRKSVSIQWSSDHALLSYLLECKYNFEAMYFIFVMFCAIWYQFEQFKKLGKHPWRSVTFSRVAG